MADIDEGADGGESFHDKIVASVDESTTHGLPKGDSGGLDLGDFSGPRLSDEEINKLIGKDEETGDLRGQDERLTQNMQPREEDESPSMVLQNKVAAGRLIDGGVDDRGYHLFIKRDGGRIFVNDETGHMYTDNIPPTTED